MGATPEIDWGATGSMMGGIASAVTAVIAVAAAVFAWKQVQESRRLNAEDAYLSFHKMSFENPEYAEPNFEAIKKNKIAFVKYHWFVIGMLICIERIINILPNDVEWKVAVLNDFDVHHKYLTSPEFQPYVKNFSRRMQAFLTGFICREMEAA